MSKPSTASAPKIPTQLPSKSAWSKGPPSNSSASSPRSQSPAPTTPVHATHSRRASGLGQSVPIRDGVNVPRSSAAAAKHGSGMTFGTIDDVSAVSAPISSSPAATPAIKSEGVKSFGSVPANAGHVNGKPSVSSSASSTAPSKPPAPATSASSSIATTPSKINKFDVRKMFQNPGTTSSSSNPAPEASSPSVRPSNLPPQPPQHQQSSSSHHQQGQPPTSSQPSQLGAHSYTPFVPGGNLRPQQQNSGPGGGPGAGSRSPVYQRPMTNGGGARPPGGPNGPGGPPPQMAGGLSSPRLGPPPHPGQQPGMPPPSEVPMTAWPAYYYPSGQPYPTGQPYMAYGQQWYMPSHPVPHQQHPQHPHQPSPHHPPQPGPNGPQYPGMPMSPRNQPPPLPVPGTPTQVHAIPAPHPVPSHSSSNSISMSSPPPTPSTATARLNTNASTFVPSRPAKISFKTPDGQDVNLDALKMNQNRTPAARPASPKVIPSGQPRSRSSVIRMESEEDKRKRIAEEKEKEEELAKLEKFKKEAIEKAKRDAQEKERKEREEAEKKKAAEEEAKEKERIRLEEEEKERIRVAEEEKARIQREEEAERLRKAEEEQRRIEEEQARLRKEEEERLKAEEEAKELARKAEEEEMARAKAAAEAEAEPIAKEPEDGEVLEAREEKENQVEALETETDEKEKLAEIKESPKDKTKDKENLRIDTAAAITPPSELPRRRPGPLNLSASKNDITPPPPSALATARIIDDLGRVSYPEGVKSPKVELNINAKDGKFRYDRDFLLQFMLICKEKPDMLPPLDAIGLEPTDQNFPMARTHSGRHRQPSSQPPTPRQASIGLGFNTGSGFGKPNAIGNFSFTPGTSKMSSEERFAASSGRLPSGSIPPNMQQYSRPTQMVRSTSQGGPGSSVGSGRTRSRRGEKRNDPSKAGPGGGQQGHGSQFGPSGPSYGPGGVPLEPVAPLELSANRWTPASISRKAQPLDADSPEIVDRKVKGLLNKLTMEKFDSISDQIIAWANKSEKEKDGRTLIQVIRLVFEKATDEAAWSEMYARLCRKMMEQISPRVQDDGIKNSEGKPIAGGQLFRKYLLNRCQEDFERGWVAKEATAAAAATKSIEDQAAKAANEKNKEDGGEGDEEVALYSDEYYAAQKAKRQGLGLIKFIGELFKLQMLTERIMHECVKKLLGNVENPEEEEIESLCKLLSTVGGILDTAKARAHMDVYFSRMKELTKSPNVSSRMQFMLQDVIELRERRWVLRNLVAAPATLAQIHETAAKEKAEKEKESFHRQISMSRGGSRRGGDRGGDYSQVGPDGWAVAGGSGAPRPPPKAGDLSNFGKINKTASMTFGPSSVFAGKKDAKRESLSRTNSNSNMFSMLSQNPEVPVEASASKSSRPPSRKPSIELAQSAAPEAAPPQRKKLNLLPRSIPTTEEPGPAATPEDSTSEEDEPATETMSEADALKKIDEDSKEFFGVRNLEEAEVYFTNLPAEHRFRLVNKLVSFALESRESDAQLVGDFFSRAVAQDLCSPDSFEEGFAQVAEYLDDIAIDAPKAHDFMVIMLKGAGMDKNDERRTRIASKSETPDKLLGLLS